MKKKQQKKSNNNGREGLSKRYINQLKELPMVKLEKCEQQYKIILDYKPKYKVNISSY